MDTAEMTLRATSLVYLQLRSLRVRLDLRDTGIELEIDDMVRYAAVWESGTKWIEGRWTRDACSFSKFGGSAAHTGVILPAGAHTLGWVIRFPDGEEALTTPVPLRVL